MKVLLTGATGLVGRHVLQALRSRPVELHAVGRRPAEQAGVRPGDGVTYHRCDLLDPAAAAALLHAVRPTHLVHSAWTMEPGRVWWDPDNLSWVGATLNLARLFTESGGQRMLAVGTCAEYDWSHGTCREDDTPLEAATLYGASKNAAHLALRSYAARAGLALCWARLFNMYGPHEDERRLVAGAIAALLAGRPFRSTDGQQLRDFMHVEDIADALATLATTTDLVGPVNVATGETVSIATVLETVGRCTGRPDLLQLGAIPRPANDPDRLVADTARLFATGWRPRLDLSSGIAATVGWWKHRSNPRS